MLGKTSALRSDSDFFRRTIGRTYKVIVFFFATTVLISRSTTNEHKLYPCDLLDLKLPSEPSYPCSWSVCLSWFPKVEACYTSMLISEHSFSLILSYVGDYCYKELTSVGIKAQVLKMSRCGSIDVYYWPLPFLRYILSYKHTRSLGLSHIQHGPVLINRCTHLGM